MTPAPLAQARANVREHSATTSIDGLQSGIPLVPLSPDRPMMLDPAVASGTWRGVLGAVKARLWLQADQFPGSIAPHAHEAGGLVVLGVPECIAALDQLYVTLQHELTRRQQLEQEVRAAQAALLLSRVELVGTQAKERRARRLALHDSLTSLPNRMCFRERLERALSQGVSQSRVLAVLYLDLDGFKEINDTYGHDIGDELLKIVAARLTRAVRAEDMVSRLGGDEFACLLAGVPSRARLIHLARKLLDAVVAPCKLGTLKLVVRPSIGIAVCPADGETVDSLLKNADTAMYRAKRLRTGLAFFDQQAES